MTVLCDTCYGNPEKAPKSLHHGGNSWERISHLVEEEGIVLKDVLNQMCLDIFTKQNVFKNYRTLTSFAGP